jgi:long-chain acyl-CoA synthetase
VIGRPWLARYPPTIPAEIDPSRYASVADLLRASFERYGDAPAFSNFGATLSFRSIDRDSRAFASYLTHELKLAKGDRVAVMLPNLLQSPIVIFGILRAGLVVVNVNPLYTKHELEHQLKDCGAHTIVVLENFAHTVAAVLARTAVKTVLVTRVGDALPTIKAGVVNFVTKHVKRLVPPWDIPGAVRYRAALALGRRAAFEELRIAPSDLAFLQYTGGTTGVSKGAVLTHRNLVANILQTEAWIAPTLRDVSGQLVIVSALPLYHVFSLQVCLVFLRLGGHNVLIPNARDFPGFVKEIGKYRVTFLPGVNTLFNALLHTPGFDGLDFSTLKVTLGGGMAVQRAVAERWKQVTGCTLSQAWGLTETSPAACINLLDAAEFNGSIGLPIPSTVITIRDDDGTELAVGQSGEICVEGPQVMRGYWNRPDETEKVMIDGRVLRTGDIGYMDPDGYVYIEDRKKDMILVSGFNVYPNEVEGVVATHPGVLEVAAVAQPDERAGEVVALFVVKKDPALTEQDLIGHCRESLTGYKVPKRVYFREALPKTNVGKILRRALKDELPK